MENKITFEQALAELEAIVHKLESGDTTLDESLELFENGIKLSGVCSSKLKEAKQKVEILLDGGEKKDFTANE